MGGGGGGSGMAGGGGLLHVYVCGRGVYIDVA